MSLPQLNTPTYSLSLPSTGQEVRYRPFLVKEQKLLLIANEGKDAREANTAIIKIIDNCTFGKLDVSNLPTFDIEYIFIKLRSKSVGENVELSILCSDDEKTRVKQNIRLDEIKVKFFDNHTNEIKVTDNIKVILDYPKLNDMLGMEDKNELELVFHILHRCIKEIHNGDDIINRVDFSDADLEDFIGQMTTSQFDLITNFFNTMPRLSHSVMVKNPNTGVDGEVTVEGLQNFLG